ncbi:MAG: tetratricopeptide repeat protein [Planctomycetota bacterium]|nr:MAG: tetratricopeptide repeat protein [Planctomycetota bacterium]
MSRIEQIEKLLADEPGDVFLNFSLAMEYAKADRHQEALQQFARVNQLDPDYIVAWYQRANTLIALDRKDEAKPVLQQGIAAARRVGDKHAVDQMTKIMEMV